MRLYEIEVPTREVVATERFKKEFEIFKRGYPQLTDNLKDFINKRRVTDRRTPTGKKDYPIQGSALQGYMHTHLVFGEVVIIYDVTPEQLQLITLGSHKIVDRITKSLSNWVLSLNPKDFTPFNISSEPAMSNLTTNEKQEIINILWSFAATPDLRSDLVNAVQGNWSKNLIDTILVSVEQPITDADKWKVILQGFNGEANLINQIKNILKSTQ